MLVRRTQYPEFKVQEIRPTERHGSPYGGWVIDPSTVNDESIIYSFGIGDDISFDLSLIKEFNCQIFAFDPTPKSIAWIESQNLPPQFHFFTYGIAGYDGRALFHPPPVDNHVSYSVINNSQNPSQSVEAAVFRLETIMEMLGHSRVDILKMDIEGAEYDVIDRKSVV